MTHIDVMKQALEALEDYEPNEAHRVATTLRQAISEAEPPCKTGASCTDKCQRCAALAEQQEPVAWMWRDGTVTSDPDRADGTWTPLYTTPPRREWVGLTEEDMPDGEDPMYDDPRFIAGMVWANNKLREKNA